MEVFDRIRTHEFHPIRDGFTYDRHLDKHGVADFADESWRVRTLAVRDLVRLGQDGVPAMIEALGDENPHVRQISAMALGILRAEAAAERLASLLEEDPDEVVRSQAAVALGQIGREESLAVLRSAAENDGSRDVRHQSGLSVRQIENGMPATDELAAAYAALDEDEFRRVKENRPAVDFELPDTDGKAWRLSDFKGEKTVVLIWIFADWCPVCHGEFDDLIELEAAFAENDVQVFTLECHDFFRSRVMTGQEAQPQYWFKQDGSPEDHYRENRWWPHLVDLGCGVGAEYGVDPMQYVVHAEWINRPATVIIDKEGIVRFAYYGTYWGDRPHIKDILEMIENDNYDFEHPERLESRKP